MGLIDEFEALNMAEIDGYISRQQEEHLHLDFKLINRADLTHSDDKKNFAKALSGFANSCGGIVVWGVDARKNPDGVDCAVRKVEIDPVTQFVSRLNELTGSAATPRVEGVRHKAIVSAGNRGFAATYVPETDSGPHMARLGEDRYYKRSGDSFYRMEHFDLEDMFGRRKKPKLILAARVTGSRPNIEIFLGLRNEGRGTAKAPYLAFDCPKPFSLSPYGLSSSAPSGLPTLPSAGQSLPYRYGANSNFVIHPGTVHDVTRLWLGHPPRKEECPRGDLIIEYEVTAEDTKLVRTTAVINLDDVW